MTLQKVAIVGRPNVGKSTLFNRLVGKRLALVDDTPGVTRDRREGEARLGDIEFIVVDTPGLEVAPERALEGRMRRQTDVAVDEAAACIFLVDARAGITPRDEVFADILRSSGKPVILLANKAEGAAGEAGVLDAWSLGVGEPIAFSAEHGHGMSELYTALETVLGTGEAEESFADGEAGAKEEESEDETGWDNPLKPLRVAIIGRPNAGKSTLVNRILGEDRMLTGPEAGITRDSISVEWTWKGETRDWPVKLFDTAGLRKKAKVQSKLEKLSVADALRAAKFAEVVVLLIDAEQPFEKQDLQIADLILREGRALVIGVNKWDLIEDKDAAARSLREQAERLLPQAPGEKGETLQQPLDVRIAPALSEIRRQRRAALGKALAQLAQGAEFALVVVVKRHKPIPAADSFAVPGCNAANGHAVNHPCGKSYGDRTQGAR